MSDDLVVRTFFDGSDPLPDSPPADPELAAVISPSAAALTEKYNETITITSSGQILIEAIDFDTPKYEEWTRSEDFHPHSLHCHCKAHPDHNLERAACPNHHHDHCPCYHLPGPLAGIIEISGSRRINLSKNLHREFLSEVLFESPGPPVAGEGDEWKRRLVGE